MKFLIAHVQYIKIQTWNRGFLVKLLYLVLFSNLYQVSCGNLQTNKYSKTNAFLTRKPLSHIMPTRGAACYIIATLKIKMEDWRVKLSYIVGTCKAHVHLDKSTSHGCVVGQDTSLSQCPSTLRRKYNELMLGVTLQWTSIPVRGGGGVEILLVA